MPNSPSAKKRHRQEVKQTVANRNIRSVIRNQVKKLRGLIAAGDAAACQTEYRETCKKLDQAAAKGILHTNTSSRYKSRLSRAIKALNQPKATA
jgi:small subunit ribosomal protein S20